MIPLFHDFTDETVLVFGGGSVGARKARRFAKEASVLVISPEFPEDEYGRSHRIRAEPTVEGVGTWFERTDPILAVAATNDPGVNEAIETVAKDHGALVNRADRSGAREAGSVVVPATARDDEVTVAVSTGGKSPALSKELRDRIEDEIEGSGELAVVTAELRQSLKERDVDPGLRRRVLSDVMHSSKVWKDLGRGDSKVRQTVDDIVEAALGDQR